MSDTASISKWASVRLAVGASMVISYFAYSCAYWFSSFRQKQKPIQFINMSQLGSKMYLYGIGCLLSLNYYQACIYSVIFTYLVMIAIFCVIGLNLIQTVSQKIRQIGYLAFYVLLFMWYMGIMIDFYVTYKNN